MGNGNFKIGDKVKRISNPYDDVKIGTTGIVTKINDGYDTVRVKIDCTGVEGTWAYSYIEKVDNQPTTIIYRKGRETIATLKDGNQTIKSAKAVCNPKDEFNAEYGAKLAFARLYGLDEQVTEILLDGIKVPKFIPSVGRIIKQDKYEIGDKVKIREDLASIEDTKGAGIVIEMHKQAGKIATITSVNNYYPYKFDIDLDNWTWTTDMIEGKVIEESIPDGTPIADTQSFD